MRQRRISVYYFPKKTQTKGMRRNFFWAGLCVLLAAFLLLWENNYQMRSRATFALGEERTIFLSFDDGPTDSTTPFLLDVLKEEGVNATFFLVGRQIKGREEIVKRTLAEGHALGIHSFTHEYGKIYASPAALLADIEACRKAIFDVTGYSPTLYRFPGGSFTVPDSLKNCVKKLGYRCVDWNASSRDAELLRASAEELYENAVSSAADRREIILLCHDFAHREETVKALPMIIRYYRERGYIFKTLS
jgi:peptidoglycan/xylan/chitin deacetylase (PgdA/CDA1 family)